ncbi:MAG: sel1 repeat family protein [Sphingomonadaceae bacterium]|nr:sel1 repeat family protein [Sphingomonadaceae bacterium]
MKINVNWPCLSALMAAALLISGCASQQYMGVSLKPGGADPAVQALAARASTGDKQAQLDLGIRFEEGAGVARDLAAAKKLYRQAASDSGGTIWIYTPPVGNGTSGRVVPVQSGARHTNGTVILTRVPADQPAKPSNETSHD